MSKFIRSLVLLFIYKEEIFMGIYFSFFLFLSIFGLHRFYVAYLYFKTKKNMPEPQSHFEELPHVTVQLPIFNEKYVIERLIDAVAAIEYPRNKLEIQILDDSTDETIEVTRDIVNNYREKGVDIVHVIRDNRIGFKAGALENGLKTCKGEFIAIFDSDFIPSPDFLMKTVHHFTDPKIGLVQARWEHINRSYSMLTQAQAILLDGHFIFEHGARNRSGRFFNFNGTAGIWRRNCIVESGGWHYDTLTEDLDLSYRAQLKGWKFVFLPWLTAPAELPVEINSFKTQQHRWAKGSIQTAFKLIPAIMKSSQPLKVKIEAGFHLLSNFAYLIILLVSLMMPASIIVRGIAGWKPTAAINIIVFVLTSLSVGSFYVLSYKEATGKLLNGILYLPFIFSFGLGLCVNNSSAVIQAITGKYTPFDRTPKFNISNTKDLSWAKKSYGGTRNRLAFFELALALYFTTAIIVAINREVYHAIPFLLLFQVGFVYVSAQSFLQTTFAKFAHRN